MDAKIEDTNINITLDISKVLKGLSEDDIQHLIEDLSCEDRVIKNVADQIIHGCTDKGWHGGKTFKAEPSTALDKAIREVAKNASDVSEQEIESLKRKVKMKEERIDELWDRIHELQDTKRRV